MAEPELASLGQSVLLEVGDADGARTRCSGVEGHGKTDRSSTSNNDRLAEVRRGTAHSAVRHGQRLDQRPDGIGHALGHLVQESRGVRDEPPHRAVRRGRAGEDDLGAQVVPSSQAHVAFPACHSWFDRHAVANCKVGHVGAHFDNLAARLVTQDEVVLDAAVADTSRLPEVDLGTADTGGFLLRQLDSGDMSD